MAQRTAHNHEFRQLRAELELTQADYAQALGIAPSTVSHYECGELQPPAPVLRLARLLLAQHREHPLCPSARQTTVGYPRGVPRRRRQKSSTSESAC